jgi:Skp family chaperone for outer membrane proteins
MTGPSRIDHPETTMRTVERLALVIIAVVVALLVLRDVPFARTADARSMMLSDEPVIAVCAIPALVNELMQSDRFLPERTRVEEEGQAELRQLRDEANRIRDEVRERGPDDPGAQEGIRRFRNLAEKIARSEGELAQRLQRLTAEHLGQCYDLARSSAVAVAEDLGFEYVIASGSADEELNRQVPEVLLRQITARPMLKAPEEADITADVRDDLNLE